MTHGPAPDLTPPPVPHPQKKAQLAAAKRLEKELRAEKSKGNKTEVPKKSTESKGKKTEIPKKSTESKGKKTKGNKGDNKPAPLAGPMQIEMKKFVDGLKANGYGHFQAMDLWKQSKERAKIVNAMSESERKRRRY